MSATATTITTATMSGTERNFVEWVNGNADRIKSLAALRRLTPAELKSLAEEFRAAQQGGTAPLFSEYKATVSSSPIYYGSDCTTQDASRIAANLSRLIRDQFPGIAVEETALSGKTTGPDESVIEDIDRWIQDNWTAAL